ncbi:cytochrome d ubiquinol oxidase subunit II [Campylobacter sp. 19-13652]|uniref:cytochrome d ubiquinol oxidase subunit II n=1 Tax=Campylobacter sp. 19-13652 TaxID=2840180 RepID=UPI001C74D239|nr:cytochrome d ubiquinol oxidase subunit II [Campylobacter sp. 19-13652]BCX80264.1 cytochrome d ubiquinol oxidase subunit II [Campylobacter sp. 19-13652]
MDLQIYWWCVLSLLGGLFVFMLFVGGGQSLLFCVGWDETAKDLIINALGRKWELSFTTLVMFGGAAFAAFPLFYASYFGGAYWLWLAILFCFIVQAVSYEYRKKKSNFLGQRTYEAFLVINGTLGTFLIGVTLSALFGGAEFSLSEMRFVSWDSPWRGLELLASPSYWLLGLALIFLSRLGGAMYFINRIDEPNLVAKCASIIRKEAALFLLFFLGFMGVFFSANGYYLDATSGEILSRPYALALSLISLPVLGVCFVLGVVGVLASVWLGARASKVAIWAYGVGCVLVGFALLAAAGLGGAAFFASTSHPASSLHIYNASSSPYTLGVMAWVSLLVPFVLAYIAYVWRALEREQVSKAELESSEHKY